MEIKNNIVVLECPSEAYLDSLVDNEIFKKHQATAVRNEDFAHTVVHFTPQKIMNHPKYVHTFFSPKNV